MRVCRNVKFRHTLLSCVGVSKMQGAEIEDDGSVQEYITNSVIQTKLWFCIKREHSASCFARIYHQITFITVNSKMK